MTPERVAAAVTWWVRCYTRHLPPDAAERRLGELESDLHEHIAQERAAGRPDAAIAREVATRALRGAPDDVLWRRHELQRTPAFEHGPMTRRAMGIIVAVVVVVLLLPAIGMVTRTGADWGVMDFVLAALLVGGAGVLLERVVRRPPGLLGISLLVAVGSAAMVLGELDDAPGLVGLGMLLVLLTIARGVWRPAPRV